MRLTLHEHKRERRAESSLRRGKDQHTDIWAPASGLEAAPQVRELRFAFTGAGGVEVKRASRHFGVFNRSVAREDHPAQGNQPSVRANEAWDPLDLGHARQHQRHPRVAWPSSK